MPFGLHGAIREVRQLRQRILAKQRFKGYSGRARALGGCVTIAGIREGVPELLPGLWMGLYGLANLASRQVLPIQIRWVGAWYIAAGAGCLALPDWAWSQPLVMGGTFFIGEWLGGLVLHYDEDEGRTVWSFFGLPNLSQNYE